LVDKFFVPKAQRMVAGGEGASRNHRNQAYQFESRQGRRTSIGLKLKTCPALLPERKNGSPTFRWFRFAAPPAKLQRAAGAQNLPNKFLFNQLAYVSS